MKYIKDMSSAEAYSWVSLLATAAIFAFFYQRMTHGLNVVQYSPGELMRLFIAVIIMTAIIHSIIAGVFASRRKGNEDLGFGEFEKDERDIEIERKGDRFAYWFVVTAINTIIFVLIFQYTMPIDYDPSVSVIEPSSMYFFLMATMFIGDIIKRATMVLEYRK